MRIPVFTMALLLPIRAAIHAAEPPPLPKEINVAGANCDGAASLKHRAPKNLAELSGNYHSVSMTDGHQKLQLKARPNGSGGWVVDGTISTSYAHDPSEVVKFTNAPLRTNGDAAWFETGIPKLVGHVVTFKAPRLTDRDPEHPWEPAVVISDSVYCPDENKAARAASNRRARK